MQNVVSDRVHQVRFAKADVSVNEKRVVNVARRFRNRQRGRIREAIRIADHEIFKRVFRIQNLLFRLPRLLNRALLRENLQRIPHAEARPDRAVQRRPKPIQQRRQNLPCFRGHHDLRVRHRKQCKRLNELIEKHLVDDSAVAQGVFDPVPFL